MFKFKEQSQEQMRLIRIVLGIVCFFLPELSVLPGFLAYAKNGPEFWWSVSATFYATSGPHMIAALKITSIFFLCYKGYSWFDRILSLIMSAASYSIAAFPCLCAASTNRVGEWQVPIEISSKIHNASAAILFISFWVMVRFGFTKHGAHMTVQKQIRNNAYILCSIFMFCGMANQIVTSVLDIKPMTIVNETVMLKAFGIAWLIKAGLCKSLND